MSFLRGLICEPVASLTPVRKRERFFERPFLFLTNESKNDREVKRSEQCAVNSYTCEVLTVVIQGVGKCCSTFIFFVLDENALVNVRSKVRR